MEIGMNIRNALLASLTLAVAIGCGGGGGGTGTGPGTGSGQAVRLFATDDMTTAYDHVWVSVKQVVLVGANGESVLFDEPAGRQIDLKTLRDEAGRRFRLLSNRSVSSGQYTGLRVVVDANLVVFPTGATTGTEATFDGSDATEKVLTLDFGGARPIGGGSDLIVDFDLSAWTLEGTTVTATNGQFLKLVTDNSVGRGDRQEADDYHGIIGGLNGTAPNQTFTITRGGVTLNVQTDANTAIYNENGAASPALVNGARVEVYGTFSTSSNALIARSIKIEDDENDENELFGQVTAVAAGDGTVTVNVIRSFGFLPTTETLVIQTSDTTRYFARRGVRLTRDAFFTGIQVGSYVEAEGFLTNGVLNAKKVKIEDGDGHRGGGGGGDDRGNEAEVRGRASDANAAANTFKVTATEWEGLILSAGQTITVTTTGGTEFKVNGNNVSAGTFYSSLGSATSVKVEGDYDADTNTLRAREAKIGENRGGGGGGDDDDDDRGGRR